MIKYLKLAALILVGSIVVLFLAKNVIAKVAVESGAKLVTGLKLEMESLKINLFDTSLGVNNLRLHNPKGYQDKVMVNLPEFYVDYTLSDILKGNIHLPELRLNLEEILIVKNADGSLNIDSLTALQKSKEGTAQKKPEAPKAAKKEKGKAPQIQLDRFTLHIGQVVYKDYSKKGGEPSVKTFKVNLNEEFRDITNPYSLVSIIVVKVMMSTPLAALTNFDVAGLSSGVTDALASSTELAKNAANQAQSLLVDTGGSAVKALGNAGESLKDATGDPMAAAKSLTGDLGDAASSITDGLKNTTSDLKDKLKMSFGKSE